MTTGKDQILLAVRKEILPHLGEDVLVHIGLSGGLDSVVLLHALVQLRSEVDFRLSAIHVHHGLSPHADDWAIFCQKLCAELGVPCQVIRCSLPQSAGKGIEQIAREARYAAFNAVPGDILCLAHHQNDRAETLLLNLFRGAGSLGLAGLPPQRQVGARLLLRPLINLPRQTLQDWAQAWQIAWIEDESNQLLHYRRNYLRHYVIPQVAQAFPGVIAVLARTSAQMAEQTLLLDRLAGLDAMSARHPSGRLSVRRLQTLPEPAVRNVLRFALNEAGIRIPAARRLSTLVAQVMRARQDAEILVSMGAVAVHVWRDRLWLDWGMQFPVPRDYSASANRVDWPDGRLTICTQTDDIGRFCVRALGHGQQFQPMGRCREGLGELLRTQGVPPWVRPRLPGLWSGNTLVWVPGLGWSGEIPSANTKPPVDLAWQEKPMIAL